ncbi:hypothetical protein N9R86_00570 [Alphaproteobacteria bacterium]|nr:hypothetical protein [Alphaproteobacteria bacterium]
MKKTFIFFLLTLLVRLGFIFFQGSSIEQYLIEDELMYWENSLSFLKTGELNKGILYERMPSIFLYYKMLLLLTSENLKFLLCIQAVIDTVNCFMIYRIASLIVPRYKFFIYGFAALSPLMIILSSQVLSETIFLFFFILFIYFSIKAITQKNNLFLFIMLAGLFLGISTSFRTITFPLIFLSLIPLTIIFINKRILKFNLFILLSTFLLSALLPISLRLIDNIKNHNSYSLTSQTGTHLAYWVAPIILSESEGLNRSDALKIIIDKRNKHLLTDDPYKNDAILRSIGITVLAEVSLNKVIYAWGKGILINLSAPSILLDKKLRNLAHPSYYEISNPIKWILILVSEKKYYNYLLIISLASITSIFSILSLIIGPVLLYKENKHVSYLCLLYVLYFMIITGPVLSPKYIFPILPCVFLYQAFTLVKIKDIFFQNYWKLKNN